MKHTLSLSACFPPLPNRRVVARGLQVPNENPAACRPGTPTGRVFKSHWLRLCLAAALATFVCGDLSAEDSKPKPVEPAKAPANDTPAKLTAEQQKAVDFAKRYDTARTPRSKHEAWRGVREVQLRVRLADAEAKAALSEERVVKAFTEKLASAGIKVVESDGAPFLYLSVNTVDSGPALGFDVRLELLEETVLVRPGSFLKIHVKSWDTAQFGTASQAALSQQLSNAVLGVLKSLSAGLGEAQ